MHLSPTVQKISTDTRDRNLAELSALSLANGEQGCRLIPICGANASTLTSSQPAVGKHGEQRTIAPALHRVRSDGVKERLEFVIVEISAKSTRAAT